MPSLREVSETGDRLRSLRTLRDALAGSIDECESMRDLAALSRQFTEVLSQIADLPDAQAEVSAADEVARRRAARRSGSAGKARTARSS